MKNGRSVLCSAFLLAATSHPAGAVILFGLDNSNNQTDPGTGVPFDSVGLVTDLAMTDNGKTGSAIHLGGGYMLTADHVGMSNYVTFDGTTFYQRDLGFSPVQVAANVDMKIFRLSSVPTVAAAQVYTGTSEEVAPATMVGWGVGRNPAITVDSASVTWGTEAATTAKRWAWNTPKALTAISYGSYSYTAIETILGSESGTPAGLGENEGALTLNDSGSALFQNIAGTWYLIGLATTVETGGTSNFGNDQTANPNGDANYFVRVGNYDEAILAVVPEVHIWLLAAAGLPLVMRRNVSRH
ncbi:MAG: hypothetical protein H7A50_05895 [Akkermansiaceae bacterium]|nr:hypothetical protein [Akkermansiaceae bacterium]